MKKILIVDDKQEIRDLVEVTLRISDYKIFKASNGEQGVRIAQEEKPDLIIMDIMMPGKIDGLQAAKLLKSSEDTRGSTILILTAKGQKADLVKGKEAGVDGYFVKPFSPLELIQRVESELET